MFLKDDTDLCIIVGLLFSLFSLHEYVLCFLQPVLRLFLHMFFLYNNINISYREWIMGTLRQFSLFDMLHYNNVNLDVMTETFNSYFYAKYLIKWPEYCVSLWNSVQSIQAYCKFLGMK